MKPIEYVVKVDEYGTKRWYHNNKLHREDGPACEYADGTKSWYINGNYHREDGPALEYANGTKFWYINGKLHREDGPAVEYADGTKFWYINGELHCEDGPALEYADGSKYWYINGKELTEKKFNARRTKQKTALKVGKKIKTNGNLKVGQHFKIAGVEYEIIKVHVI